MRKNIIGNMDKVIDTASVVFNNCNIDCNVKGNKVNLIVKGNDGSNWGCCSVDANMSVRKMEQVMRRFKMKHRDITNNAVREFKTRTIDFDLSLVL